MSTTFESDVRTAAAPGPARWPRTSETVALRLVIGWHLLASLAFAWVAWNIVAAVWSLESFPRTAIGIGSTLGLLANVAVAVMLLRSARRSRIASFTLNYLTAIVVVVLLFQSLSLANYLDDFSASFSRAFPPFIGIGVAVAWLVIARRIESRLHDDDPQGVPPALHGAVRVMKMVGLVAIAGFTAVWLWSMRPWELVQVLWATFTSDPVYNAMLIVALACLAWCAKTMWATRMAHRFGDTGEQLESQAGWLYLSPNLIGFILFFAGPLVFSLVISFYDWNGITSPTFVGLSNYIQTLGITVASSAESLPAGFEDMVAIPSTTWVLGASDPLFWRSMSNILIFLVLGVPLAVAPALILAVLIHTGYRGTKTFRTIFFVPAVAGVIGVTLIWKQMLNSTVGFINWTIGVFNGAVNAILPGDPLPEPVEIGWLSDPSVALFAVVLVFAWSQFGFNTVLFTAGMQGISRELHEAAELDGAGPWRRFFSVTLPSLRATTFFVIASTVILALQLFDIVYALNQPNPVGFPDNATLTPVVYLYQLGFQQDAFGRASAVAWVLFIVIFSLTLLQFRRQRRYAEES